MFVRMFICLSKSMEVEGGWRRGEEEGKEEEEEEEESRTSAEI